MKKLQLTNKELIKELKKYPKNANVNLSVIVNSKMLTHQNGDEDGIYFVDGAVIDVTDSFENDNDLTILALDDNYDGYGN